MKTEAMKGTVATRSEVDDESNPYLDEMGREGEDAIRSVEASLQAVRNLSSILSSVKKRLDDEKRLRLEAENRVNILERENARLMRRVTEIREIRKRLDELERRKWQQRHKEGEKHGTTKKVEAVDTKTGKVSSSSSSLLVIDSKSSEAESDQKEEHGGGGGDKDRTTPPKRTLLPNGNHLDRSGKFSVTPPDGENSPCILDPPYAAYSPLHRERSVGWVNSRDMCRITPPSKICLSEAQTPPPPLLVEAEESHLLSKAAMACIDEPPSPDLISRSKMPLGKSPNVNIGARGGKRQKRKASTTVKDAAAAPMKSGRPFSTHKYHEVIRNKDERAKMTGVDCPECRDFLNMIEDQGLIEDRQGFLDRCSRHRVKCGYGEENTPEDYWRLSFLDESPTVRAPFPGISVYPAGFDPNHKNRKQQQPDTSCP